MDFLTPSPGNAFASFLPPFSLATANSAIAACPSRAAISKTGRSLRPRPVGLHRGEGHAYPCRPASAAPLPALFPSPFAQALPDCALWSILALYAALTFRKPCAHQAGASGHVRGGHP